MTQHHADLRPIKLSIGLLFAAALTACGGSGGTTADDVSVSALTATTSIAEPAPTMMAAAYTQIAGSETAAAMTVSGSVRTPVVVQIGAPSTSQVVPAGSAGPAAPAKPAPGKPALGSLAVGWVAPTISADGTPLNDLAGFKIFIGTSSGNYSSSVTVNDPRAVSFRLADLPKTTYYVAIKAFDSSNNESLLSAELSKAL